LYEHSGGEQHLDFKQYLVLLLLLLLIVLLLFYLGYLLSIFVGVGSSMEALSLFIVNRVKCEPWSSGELSALCWFIVTVLLFGLLLFVVSKFLSSWFGSWRADRLVERRFSSEYGTASWGVVRDLRKLLGCDGLVVGYQRFYRPVRLSLRASCEHVAVIGPTGCGKTTSYFVPNLLLLPEGTSAVVTDPKGEIESIVGPVLRERGWETVVFSLANSSQSSVYNPLSLARDETEISEIADITLLNGYSSSGMSGDMQWVNFSQPLWEAALLMEVGLKSTVSMAT